MIDLLSEILDLPMKRFTALTQPVPQFGGTECEVVVYQRGREARRYRLKEAVMQEFEAESLAERSEGSSPLHTVLIAGVVVPLEGDPCTTS